MLAGDASEDLTPPERVRRRWSQVRLRVASGETEGVEALLEGIDPKAAEVGAALAGAAISDPLEPKLSALAPLAPYLEAAR